MENVLVAENVNKHFADHKALQDINLSIPKNGIFGLLGPNGAGKTTFIRIINQITAPDSGHVRLFGQDLKPEHVHRIGYLPEERGLYKKMKVGEQAIYLAQLKGLTARDAKKKLKFWFEKFEIGAWWDKKVEELSKGMQQKIQFIVTVLHEPELLIFDEPFSGFDPINANLLKQEILNLRDAGSSIIFSTHNMSSVEEICDHIALINKSKLILEGPVQDVKDSYKQGIYRIQYVPHQKGMVETLPQQFELKSLDDNDRSRTAVVKIQSQNQTNDLLQYFMNNSQIQLFEEVVPSMNDIFIQKVEEENLERKNNE
jgi:ABC-2 type transport system ATP-binding protein